MNSYLILILALLIGGYALDTLTELLNLATLKPGLPEEFRGVFDEEKYRTSLRYQETKLRFGLIQSSILLVIVLGFLLVGGFNSFDKLARSFGAGSIGTGLLYFALLGLARLVLGLPFNLYDTFVIEEKFGFNRTRPQTFVADLLKGLLLTVLLGGPVLALLLYFFERTGPLAWVYSWSAFSLIQLTLLFLAPAFILPLFNKFEPLSEGPLKDAIRDYAASQNFVLSGIFRMDSSKRSTKSNAFFTGFGKFRRLVLFDTLIEKHTIEELVAVLAHEIGHFKRRHILKTLVLSIASTGLLFRFLSLFIGNSGLFEAFRMEQVSVYASLVFVGFLYSPVSRLFSILTHFLSRRHEFEADEYAVRSYKRPDQMISALKKLSVDNLSHLTPHPLKVFLDYTHPPVLTRIRRISGTGSREPGFQIGLPD